MNSTDLEQLELALYTWTGSVVYVFFTLLIHALIHRRRKRSAWSADSKTKRLIHSDSDSASDSDSDWNKEEDNWYERGFCPKPKLMRPEKLLDENQSLIKYKTERDVTWSELFCDLIFVVAVARLDDSWRETLNDVDASTHEHIIGVLSFVCFFAIFWQLWLQWTLYTNRYGADDLFNKVAIAIFMLMVVLMTVHVPGGIESEFNFPMFMYSKVLAEGIMIVKFLRIAYFLPGTPRQSAIKEIHERLLLIGLDLVLATRVLPSYRIYWLFVTIFINGFRGQMMTCCGSCFYPRYMPSDQTVDCRQRAWCICCCPPGRKTEDGKENMADRWWFHSVAVPLHLEHFTERFGCLAIIFLGNMVDDLTLDKKHYERSFYISICLCMGIIFSMKMALFDTDLDRKNHHAIRVNQHLGMIWVFSSLPLAMGIVIMGAGMHMICAFENQNPASISGNKTDLLAEQLLTEEENPINIVAGRQLVCWGVALALGSATVAALTHRREWHKVRKRNGMGFERDEHFREVISHVLKKIFCLQITVQFLFVAVIASLPFFHLSNLSNHSLLAIVCVSMVTIVALNLVDEMAELCLLKKHKHGQTTLDRNDNIDEDEPDRKISD